MGEKTWGQSCPGEPNPACPAPGPAHCHQAANQTRVMPAGRGEWPEIKVKAPGHNEAVVGLQAVDFEAAAPRPALVLLLLCRGTPPRCRAATSLLPNVHDGAFPSLPQTPLHGRRRPPGGGSAPPFRGRGAKGGAGAQSPSRAWRTWRFLFDPKKPAAYTCPHPSLRSSGSASQGAFP